ncbi:uncharacterized protein LOC118188623 [Stegodyphus dumicola]|uniref:uncharacterized protein LOC118188623 n=1 Tax=Stegodyphus dumicola TaxID=202533 RepID=UPI0015AA8644|nr:uncharacterized protein LOC118188623 [Stegodyphus dumicola]
MSGFQWGLNPHIQKLLYQTVIVPIVTYGAAVWSQPMQGRKVRSLQSIQRSFLLNISKAFRTTSTSALQVITGLLPLHLRTEQEGARQLLKLLNQQVTFYGEHYSPEDYERPYNRLRLHPAAYGLGVHVTLRESTQLPDGDYYIYTDGSKIEDNTGCAFAVFHHGTLLHQWKAHLHGHNSVFQGEAFAIVNATKYILEHQILNCCIVTDSQSVLAAAMNPVHPSIIISQLQELLLRLGAHLNIQMFWTRAHMGTIGNELADELAKQAAMNDDAINSPLAWPISHFLRKLHLQSVMQWQVLWDAEDTGRRAHYHLGYVDETRLLANSQLVRYVTGHGPFPVYFARFNITSTDQCVCGQAGTPEHYVSSCELTRELHIPFPAQHQQAFSKFLIKQRHLVRKLTAIMSKLMHLGTDLCQPV